MHAAETCFLSRQDKLPESQRQRAKVLFEIYPDLKEAYSLTHSLSMIFSRNAIKDAARL
ncbi:transposase [uncultured Prevotella sp.]|uniref:transposase n=1 Tax=uncultured Prevotella sp. TaxID=159272 RepID=UPI0034173620